jgi:hypothetical protein
VPRASSRILILDACVLIDFCDADASVLPIISRALGEICVASTVLAEVAQLGPEHQRTQSTLDVPGALPPWRR